MSETAKITTEITLQSTSNSFCLNIFNIKICVNSYTDVYNVVENYIM